MNAVVPFFFFYVLPRLFVIHDPTSAHSSNVDSTKLENITDYSIRKYFIFCFTVFLSAS